MTPRVLRARGVMHLVVQTPTVIPQAHGINPRTHRWRDTASVARFDPRRSAISAYLERWRVQATAVGSPLERRRIGLENSLDADFADARGWNDVPYREFGGLQATATGPPTR